MDQMPKMQEGVSIGEHNKSPVVAIFIGVMLIAVAAIGYWIMRQQAKIPLSESETSSLSPAPAGTGDTSAAIDADFNAIDADSTNLDTEFKDVDAGVNQL